MKRLTLTVLLLSALAVHAQPIDVVTNGTGGGGGFQDGTPGTFQSNLSQSYTVTGNRYEFNLRGDVTAQMSGTAAVFLYQGAGFFTLTTGPAPVLLTDIAVSYNGKEVVSGGSSASFLATQFYRATLYVPGFGEDTGYATYLPDRISQGVFEQDLTENLPSTLLAANTAYTLYMDVYPIVRISDYPSSSSMLGYALEFGGDVAPFYRGLSMSFIAQAVPEPGALAMLGLGLGVVLLRVRRHPR